MRCRFSLHNRFLGPQFQSEVRTSAVLIGKRSDAISVISAIAELHCAPPETAVVLSLRGSSTGRLSLDDTAGTWMGLPVSSRFWWPGSNIGPGLDSTRTSITALAARRRHLRPEIVRGIHD